MAAATPIVKKPQGTFARQLGAFFRRFHMIIFFIVIVGAIAGVVMMINKTLTESSEQTYTSTTTTGTIDAATLERVQSLHASNQPTASAPVEGRTNPFGE